MDRAERIKRLRKRHNLTQVKLAKSLYGVSEQSVANWESGRRGCPDILWWAMKLIWDKVDIRHDVS